MFWQLQYLTVDSCLLIFVKLCCLYISFPVFLLLAWSADMHWELCQARVRCIVFVNTLSKFLLSRTVMHRKGSSSVVPLIRGNGDAANLLFNSHVSLQTTTWWMWPFQHKKTVPKTGEDYFSPPPLAAGKWSSFLARPPFAFHLYSMKFAKAALWGSNFFSYIAQHCWPCQEQREIVLHFSCCWFAHVDFAFSFSCVHV